MIQTLRLGHALPSRSSRGSGMERDTASIAWHTKTDASDVGRRTTDDDDISFSQRHQTYQYGNHDNSTRAKMKLKLELHTVIRKTARLQFRTRCPLKTGVWKDGMPGKRQFRQLPWRWRSRARARVRDPIVIRSTKGKLQPFHIPTFPHLGRWG